MSTGFEYPPAPEFPPSLPDQPVPESRFPVWSGWDVLLLLCFASFSAIFMGAVGGAVSHLLQIKISSLQGLPRSTSEGIFLLCYQAVLDVLILLFIYFTVTLKYNSLFLPSIRWVHQGISTFLTYFPLGIVLALAVLGASTLIPTPTKPPIEELLKHPATAFLFAALGVFLAPFVEEVVFRGFIYPVIERRGGKLPAVVSTALLFTAVHVSQLWGSWAGILLILLVGLTLSTVRARTNSVVPGFAIHLAYNSTIAVLFAIGAAVKGFPE